MNKKAKVTITDVAQSARVSVGTVSRVLNNHPEVNASIRARVWQTARRLNYTRIRQRSVRSRARPADTRIGHIATVFFGMDNTLVHLPVVNAALQGIESALSAHGRSLMLANIPKGERIPPFLLEEHRVVGVILKGPNQGLLPSPEENELLRRLYRLPHVWLMGQLPNATGDHCNFDTDAAGRLAAEHFHAKGHCRLAFFNPKPGQNQFERLKHAFCLAARRQGSNVAVLEVPRPEKLEWPLPAITVEENVEVLVDRWRAMPANRRPTALFVPSDRTSVQFYAACARRDLRVGTDVSIVSCNNEQSLSATLHPALSSIDVHAEVIGRRTVEQLLWRMREPAGSPSCQILVEPTLVERASVASLAS